MREFTTTAAAAESRAAVGPILGVERAAAALRPNGVTPDVGPVGWREPAGRPPA